LAALELEIIILELTYTALASASIGPCRILRLRTREFSAAQAHPSELVLDFLEMKFK
jgi:hypothetical protein